jgi:hypothetical protein
MLQNFATSIFSQMSREPGVGSLTAPVDAVPPWHAIYDSMPPEMKQVYRRQVGNVARELQEAGSISAYARPEVREHHLLNAYHTMLSLMGFERHEITVLGKAISRGSEVLPCTLANLAKVSQHLQERLDLCATGAPDDDAMKRITTHIDPTLRRQAIEEIPEFEKLLKRPDIEKNERFDIHSAIKQLLDDPDEQKIPRYLGMAAFSIGLALLLGERLQKLVAGEMSPRSIRQAEEQKLCKEVEWKLVEMCRIYPMPWPWPQKTYFTHLEDARAILARQAGDLRLGKQETQHNLRILKTTLEELAALPELTTDPVAFPETKSAITDLLNKVRAAIEVSWNEINWQAVGNAISDQLGSFEFSPQDEAQLTTLREATADLLQSGTYSRASFQQMVLDVLRSDPSASANASLRAAIGNDALTDHLLNCRNTLAVYLSPAPLVAGESGLERSLSEVLGARRIDPAASEHLSKLAPQICATTITSILLPMQEQNGQA